jgi:hypothetical protein
MKRSEAAHIDETSTPLTERYFVSAASVKPKVIEKI